MATPEVSGGDANGGGTPTARSAESTPIAHQAQHITIESRLSVLKELCDILGINYVSRVKELGLKPGQEVTTDKSLSLSENIRTLRRIRDTRYEELKINSCKVIELWRASFRALSKGVDLHKLYAVRDARSSADMREEKILSTTWLDLVKAEKDKFNSAAVSEYKDKYQRRKKTLMELLKLTHLTATDVKFYPHKKVVDEMYENEARSIKNKIKELKPQVLDRKELVFRAEQLRKAIFDRESTSLINVLLRRARGAAAALRSDPSSDDLKYDGHQLEILLNNLWSVACSLREDLEVEKAEVALTRLRTRSAARMQDSADTTRQPVASLDEWTRTDRKMISYLALNVANTQNTIACYTQCFGMKVSKELQHNGRDYTFLGFESDITTLEFVCNQEDGLGTSVGEGFGHLSLTNSDVRRLAKKVEALPFCKLVTKPCRLQGCSTLIVFASDPNGILFEIIEGSAKSEPVCRIVLYADNIDDSMQFYEKALGMRVLKKKDEEKYKMVWMSFEAGEKQFVLELRTSEDDRDDRSYENGDVYDQIIIETEDVHKSYEVLNNEVDKYPEAEIFEVPAADKKMCSFQDPNGWRWALIERADPDKLKHIMYRKQPSHDSE